MTPVSEPLLAVDQLTTAFPIDGAWAPAVNGVSFAMAAGETMALVGESGCGKSLTALSIMRLVELPGQIRAGAIRFRGRNLLDLGEREMQRVRGADIALILQEPMTALNPVFTIGSQIAEPLKVHGIASGRAARARAIELLDAVRVPEPQRRVDEYPHQLSGGLRQRALIAAALACRPALLIADEPTTALDVTIQAQILDLLRDLKRQFELSLLLITHDLGIVAQTADRVAVMYAGRIVESAPVRQLFADPKHPYTRGLLASLPGRTPGARLQAIEGTVPRLGRIPKGCAFAPRCPARFAPCDDAVPALAPPTATASNAAMPAVASGTPTSAPASGAVSASSGSSNAPASIAASIAPAVLPPSEAFSARDAHLVRCYLHQPAPEPAGAHPGDRVDGAR
jgi:oligopeptide/dipeptide ABC transporter ATP-binding protein